LQCAVGALAEVPNCMRVGCALGRAGQKSQSRFFCGMFLFLFFAFI
jgi:hypothetical protein